MKRNLKVAPFLTLVARGGPVARSSAIAKPIQIMSHTYGYVEKKISELYH